MYTLCINVKKAIDSNELIIESLNCFNLILNISEYKSKSHFILLTLG